ncbi:MAG: hypothetical protein N2C12_04560 [Planctomycetales bacterium]
MSTTCRARNCCSALLLVIAVTGLGYARGPYQASLFNLPSIRGGSDSLPAALSSARNDETLNSYVEMPLPSQLAVPDEIGMPVSGAYSAEYLRASARSSGSSGRLCNSFS